MNTLTLIIILLVKILLMHIIFLRFGVGDRVRLLSIRTFLVTVTLKYILRSNSVLKINRWAYRMKDLDREIIKVRIFVE